MRVTTAFNRILEIPGASVAAVSFTPAGIVVGLRRRSKRLRCPCGWGTRAVHDRSRRRWRHLDLGASRLYLEAQIRRLACRRCGRVRTEEVPWARPESRFTRDLEDVVAWLVQRADKTTVSKLLRVSWESVARIVARVVADHLDERRLDRLFRIGVDEFCYRKQHQYLTVVADHDRQGAVVWAGEGRDSDALNAFYEELGEERRARLEAVSLDMGGAYAKATAEKVPQAKQCVDPFHVIKLANAAIDKTRRWLWRSYRHSPRHAEWIKGTRWALLKDPDDLKPSQKGSLERLRGQRSVLYRAYLIKEALRDVYRAADPEQAAERLTHWLAWACRSRIPAILTLSKTVRQHLGGILDAIRLGLSNSKLEGLNSKIRLINHRGYGHHSAAAIISMIYLCCGGITVTLPTER